VRQDPSLAERVRVHLRRVLARYVAGEIVEQLEPTSVHGRDLVGGVVAIRGAWWGLVVLRCDRGLALQLHDVDEAVSVDGLMRRVCTALAADIAESLDPAAQRSRAVALAIDNAEWVPESGVLQATAEVRVDRWIARVEVYRRRRSDEVPTPNDELAT
jgi:hypothetical protein